MRRAEARVACLLRPSSRFPGAHAPAVRTSLSSLRYASSTVAGAPADSQGMRHTPETHLCRSRELRRPPVVLCAAPPWPRLRPSGAGAIGSADAHRCSGDRPRGWTALTRTRPFWAVPSEVGAAGGASPSRHCLAERDVARAEGVAPRRGRRLAACTRRLPMWRLHESASPAVGFRPLALCLWRRWYDGVVG